MLSEKVSSLLNEQIVKELYSAYLYLDFADYYSEKGLVGFENWFYIQAQEERDHAMMIRTYLLDAGHKVKLLTIDAPGESYTDFGVPLKKSLQHEQFVTASIHNIFKAAQEEQDYRTLEFLNWFVKEQAEEEKSASDLIAKYELFARDGAGLHSLDKELAERVYTAPAAAAE